MVVLLVFQLSGCALIGFGIGAIADSSSKKNNPIHVDTQFIPLKHGMKITVYLKSGKVEEGKCIAVVRVSRDGYAEAYAEARDRIKGDVILPALGENISLVKKIGVPGRPETSMIEEVEFLGFDHGGISVRKSAQTQPTLVLFDSLQSLINQHGQDVNMELIKWLVSEQKIPFLSSVMIRLKAGDEEALIDLTDIYVIEVTSWRNRIGFFLVGLSIDILWALVAGFYSPLIWILYGPPDH